MGYRFYKCNLIIAETTVKCDPMILYIDIDIFVSTELLYQLFRYILELGAVSIRKTVLPGMAIPMLKIRRPNGRLIFNMEIAIRR